MCWEGVDVDGEALGAGFFEGDGSAKVGTEERTSMGAYVNGTEQDRKSGNTARRARDRFRNRKAVDRIASLVSQIP